MGCIFKLVAVRGPQCKTPEEKQVSNVDIGYLIIILPDVHVLCLTFSASEYLHSTSEYLILTSVTIFDIWV